MKIVLIPDSFKGTLSSEEAAAIMEKEVLRCFPNCETVKIPMADGGEGTEKVMVELMKGRHISCEVHDPLGRVISSGYGLLDENTALIEMASASGLTLVEPFRRNPFLSSSFGTGELIARAVKDGCRKLIIAIGGSATNDGGMGAMEALGVVFRDEKGQKLRGRAENLIKIKDIDCSALLPKLEKTRITVMCDVKNPLLGKTGATYVYGPQKGADPEMLEKLEAGMENYASVLKKTTGTDLSDMAGAGAAGGMGGALYAFCKGELRCGADIILDLIHFSEILENTDLVITGEGRLDGQSASGKVLDRVGEYCLQKNVPAIAITGCIGAGAEAIYSKGIRTAFPIIQELLPEEELFARSRSLLADATNRVMRLLQLGMKLGGQIL